MKEALRSLDGMATDLPPPDDMSCKIVELCSALQNLDLSTYSNYSSIYQKFNK